jgi:hypothetical protein
MKVAVFRMSLTIFAGYFTTLRGARLYCIASNLKLREATWDSHKDMTFVNTPHHMFSQFFFPGWGETDCESTWYVGHCWPIVPAPDDRWWLWSSWWDEDWQGKPKYSEKTCPSASLSTTNPTWPDLGSNPGRRGGKPETNRLSYGAAYMCS